MIQSELYGNIKRIYGNDISVTNCEEAYQIETEDKFSTVVESIRGTYDSEDFFKQITITFNPWNERHWLKRVFFDKDTRRSDTLSLTTTYRCNEWLDKVDVDRYEDLYISNPRRARIVCDGDWGVAEGLVYDNVVIENFDLKQLLPTHKLAVGLDFGFVHDPTALIVFLIGDRDIYIFDEAYQKGLSTKEIAKMIKDKGYSNSLIIGDSAEGRLISELKSEHGIKRLKKSRKGKDSINAGISKIQGFTIHVLPTCENTINELFSYSYQQDKDGRWLNIPKDEDNHLMDAMRYGMQVLDTNRTKKLKRSDIFG